MKTKFHLILILCAILCIGAFAASANEATVDDVTYVYELLEDGTAMITETDGTGEIVIPDTLDGYTVTSLTAELFYGQWYITSVTIPATVSLFGTDDDDMWDYVFSYCDNLESIKVASDNPKFCSADGVLYSKDKTILYQYPCNKSGETYHVPEGTKYIACTAMASARNLTGIYLDDPDTIWYTYTFCNDGDATVYCLPDGSAEAWARKFMGNGLSHETDSSWPAFFIEGAGDRQDWLDKKLDEIVADRITDGMNDYQKALSLHDWLTGNANYDESLTRYTAIELFRDGLGVCQAYTEAYGMLLDKVGIAHKDVFGNNHTWNVIKLGGKWYHVDATWDDPAGESPNHVYFGLSDAAVQTEPTHASCGACGAGSYEYNYDYLNGNLDTIIDTLNGLIDENMASIETASDGVEIPLTDVLLNYDENRIRITTSALYLNGQEFTGTSGNSVCLSVSYNATGHTLNVRFGDGPDQPGWYQIGSEWYYYREDFTKQTGWEMIDGSWYFFDDSGVMQTGLQIIEGETYLFSSSGVMLTGWQQAGKIWYWLKSTGEARKGWAQEGDTWYRFDNTGAMLTGWQSIDGVRYYFRSSGAMLTGWHDEKVTDAEGHVIRTEWYYLQDSGTMATGWKQIGGAWYFFSRGTGVMQTGWQKIDGSWYYFKASGVMQTGWLKIDGSWYYFKASGAMQTGWLKLDGDWYWFSSSGVMATGTVTIDGQTYTFNASGIWQEQQSGWVKENGSWVYYASGAKATGWQSIDGSWYYFSGSGAMQTGWQEIGGTWYWFSSGGPMATGTRTVDGRVCNFSSSGAWLGYGD